MTSEFQQAILHHFRQDDRPWPHGPQPSKPPPSFEDAWAHLVAYVKELTREERFAELAGLPWDQGYVDPPVTLHVPGRSNSFICNLVSPVAHVLYGPILRWGPAEHVRKKKGVQQQEHDRKKVLRQQVWFFPDDDKMKTSTVLTLPASEAQHVTEEFLAHWPDFSDAGWQGPRVLLLGTSDPKAGVLLRVERFDAKWQQEPWAFAEPRRATSGDSFDNEEEIPPLGRQACAVRLAYSPVGRAVAPRRRPAEPGDRPAYDCTFFLNYLVREFSRNQFPRPRRDPACGGAYGRVVGLDMGTYSTSVGWDVLEMGEGVPSRSSGPDVRSCWKVLAGSPQTAARHGVGEEVEHVYGGYWPTSLRWLGLLRLDKAAEVSPSGFPIDTRILKDDSYAFPHRLALPCKAEDGAGAKRRSPPFKWPNLITADGFYARDPVESAKLLLRRYLEELFWTLFAQWLRPYWPGGSPGAFENAPVRYRLARLVVASLHAPGVPFGAKRHEVVFGKVLGEVLGKIWDKLAKVPDGLRPPVAADGLEPPVPNNGLDVRPSVSEPVAAQGASGSASGRTAAFAPGLHVVADLGGVSLSISSWLQPRGSPRDRVGPDVAGTRLRGSFMLGGEVLLDALGLVDGHRAWCKRPLAQTRPGEVWEQCRQDERQGLRDLIRKGDVAAQDANTGPAAAERLREVLERRVVGLVSLYTQAVRESSPWQLGRGAPVSLHLVGEGWKLLHLDEADEHRADRAEKSVSDRLHVFLPDLSAIAARLDPAGHVSVSHVEKRHLTGWLVKHTWKTVVAEDEGQTAPSLDAGPEDGFRPLLGLDLSYEPLAGRPEPPQHHLPFFSPFAGEKPLSQPVHVDDADRFMMTFCEESGWDPTEVTILLNELEPDRLRQDPDSLAEMLVPDGGLVQPAERLHNSRERFEGCFWSWMIREYGHFLLALHLIRTLLDTDGQGPPAT